MVRFKTPTHGYGRFFASDPPNPSFERTCANQTLDLCPALASQPVRASMPVLQEQLVWLHLEVLGVSKSFRA